MACYIPRQQVGADDDENCVSLSDQTRRRCRRDGMFARRRDTAAADTCPSENYHSGHLPDG